MNNYKDIELIANKSGASFWVMDHNDWRNCLAVSLEDQKGSDLFNALYQYCMDHNIRTFLIVTIRDKEEDHYKLFGIEEDL